MPLCLGFVSWLCDQPQKFCHLISAVLSTQVNSVFSWQMKKPRLRELNWITQYYTTSGLPWWFERERIHLQWGDLGWILGLGRPPGEGNGKPLPYSYLKYPMERGAWWFTLYGVTKSWTWLSNYHIHTTNRWQAEDFNFCFSDIVSSFWQERAPCRKFLCLVTNLKPETPTPVPSPPTTPPTPPPNALLIFGPSTSFKSLDHTIPCLTCWFFP